MDHLRKLLLITALPLAAALSICILLAGTPTHAAGTPTAKSFQRKTWFDGTRYWRSYLDEANSRIRFDYSSDGSSWTENTSARIATNTDDFAVLADGSNAYVAYPTSGGDTENSVTGTGLVTQWKMNETAANQCTGGVNDTCDSTANALNGAWNGNTTFTTGTFSNGTTFDGTDDYIQVADPGTGSVLDITSTISFSAWINPTTLPGTSTWRTIVAKGGIDDTDDASYIFQIGNDGGTEVITLCYTNGGNYHCWNGTGMDLVANTWQQIGLTMTFGNSTSVKTYHNGVEYTSGAWGSGTGTVTNTITNKALWIGADNYSDGNNTPQEEFAGAMDDVRIYNRILTSGEMQSLGTLGYDIEVRKASTYPGTTFSWGSATVSLNGSSSTNYYQYPALAADSTGKIWVTATQRNGSTYATYVVRSTTANTITAWDASSSLDSSTNSNRYATLVSRSAGAMAAVWMDGTNIESKLYNGTTWDGSPAAIDTGTSGLTTSLSAVSDSNDNVHLVYINASGQTMYRTLTTSATSTTYTYPLKVSSNANDRFLVDQNNVPFFVNSDVAWAITGQVSQADADMYLADAANRGFNSVVVTLADHHYTDNAPNNYYNVAPFTTPGDITTPNESYFANADWVINKAAEYGLNILLSPFYLGCCDDGWYSTLNMASNTEADAVTFGTWVGNRYKNFPNIVYFWANDTNPCGWDVAGTSCTMHDKIAAMAGAAQAADPNHLHTAHVSPEWSPLDFYSTTTPFKGFTLDFTVTYTYVPVRTKVWQDYNRNPVVPFFLFETNYEADFNNAQPLQIREQAYDAILSGAAGNVYGNNPIWHMNGTPGDNTNTWPSHLTDTGRTDMIHMYNLFKTRDWVNLVPDQGHNIVTAGYNSGYDYASAARLDSGESVIVYIPSQRAVTVAMTQVAGSTAEAWWYNPRDGSATFINTYATSGTQNFTPPDTNDWVLVLDNQAADLPTPGASSNYWSSAVTLDSNAGNAYPTLSINTTNNNLYAMWIRNSDIFYKKGVSDYTVSGWDANATSWQASGTNTYVTSNTSGAGYIFAEWYDGSAIQWAKILPGVVSITLTSDGTVNYGTVSTSGTANTVALTDTQTVQNDGTVAVDLSIKTSNATGGTTWTLGSSPGTNTYKHEFSTNGGGAWTPFTTADSYQSLATNIASTAAQNFDLKISLPTSTSDFTQKSISVTVMASEH